MKKILALVLALMMVLSLAACGGKTDPKPSGNDSPGASQTDDKGGTEGNKDWPVSDIPAWPDDGLLHSEHDGDVYRISCQGDDEDLEAWKKALADAGFDGWWRSVEFTVMNENYYIGLDERNDDYNFDIFIEASTRIIGFPDEIADLFPAYNGDGLLVFSEEIEAGWYDFTVYGETKEGETKYIQSLTDAGFVLSDQNYVKETDGKTLTVFLEEGFWEKFDDASETGRASISLIVT